MTDLGQGFACGSFQSWTIVYGQILTHAKQILQMEMILDATTMLMKLLRHWVGNSEN